MLTTRTKRAAAVFGLSCTLFAGVAVTPAVASPGQEAAYLAALKKEWVNQSQANRVATCTGYKLSPTGFVGLTVNEVWQNPTLRETLTKPSLKRVITKWLAWACSGPGSTPR